MDSRIWKTISKMDSIKFWLCFEWLEIVNVEKNNRKTHLKHPIRIVRADHYNARLAKKKLLIFYGSILGCVTDLTILT